jgi:protein-S-isoprenylcysteine O-methyltransferase Ste14
MIGVKVGSRVLTGPAAFLTLLVVLAALVGFVVVVGATAGWALAVSAALWILFIGYWTAAAASAAPATRTESAGSRQVHQRLLIASLVLLFLPVPGLRLRILPATFVVEVAGLAVQIASGALAVWARRHLGRNWSAAVSRREGHQLVRTGPYRRIRHPIYSAMLGMFVGTAIVAGRLHAVIGLALIVFAYWRKIGIEEANLRGLFGEEYDRYRETSWALVPGLF